MKPNFLFSGILLVFLGLLGACAPAPLDPAGTVLVWTNRQDAALDEAALGLNGLVKAEAPREEPWLRQLQNAATPPDLVLTEWGRDLAGAHRDGLLAPLDPYWARLQSRDRLWPGLLRQSLQEGRQQLIVPSSVYTWGLFFNKDTLSRSGLTLPERWADFEPFLRSLKAQGLVPLALGSSFGWPGLAWLSYIDLRLNGPEAHLRLLEGSRSFTEASLEPVFATLQRWRDEGFFDPQSGTKNWPEALADLEAGRAALTLLGAFAQNRFARPQAIGFAAVPIQAGGTPRGEIAVVQGFALSTKAAHPEAALALADAYLLAGSKGQTIDAFRLSPLRPAPDSPALSEFKALQAGILGEARGLVPQMDRLLSPQAAYDANQAAIRFFAPGSVQSGADFARVLQATRSRG